MFFHTAAFTVRHAAHNLTRGVSVVRTFRLVHEPQQATAAAFLGGSIRGRRRAPRCDEACPRLSRWQDLASGAGAAWQCVACAGDRHRAPGMYFLSGIVCELFADVCDRLPIFGRSLGRERGFWVSVYLFLFLRGGLCVLETSCAVVGEKVGGHPRNFFWLVFLFVLFFFFSPCLWGGGGCFR